MTVYAAVEDVVRKWRPLTEDETGWVEDDLAEVSAIMRKKAPGLDDRIAADPDLAIIARGIAVKAVLAPLKNPEGVTDESAGPFSVKRTAWDGQVFLSDYQISLLRGETAASSSRPRLIRMKPGLA